MLACSPSSCAAAVSSIAYVPEREGLPASDATVTCKSVITDVAVHRWLISLNFYNGNVSKLVKSNVANGVPIQAAAYEAAQGDDPCEFPLSPAMTSLLGPPFVAVVMRPV